MLYRAVLFALGLLLAAAELRVSDGEVVVKEGVAYVEVDVSWRLSWRNETNWDAAWLTVKAPVGREGVPLKLAPAGHRIVDTDTPDEPGPTFSVSEDSVGTFVYRDARTEDRGPDDWTLRLRLVLPKCATPASVREDGFLLLDVPSFASSPLYDDPSSPESASRGGPVVLPRASVPQRSGPVARIVADFDSIGPAGNRGDECRHVLAGRLADCCHQQGQRDHDPGRDDRPADDHPPRPGRLHVDARRGTFGIM